MVPRIEIDVSGSVIKALRERQADSGNSLSEVVENLLGETLELERHSLFQVSTSNALVEGVFQGSVTVGQLRTHGDFGLGTFSGLDGEMIMDRGECYRATADGELSKAEDDREVPFALVTWFEPDVDASLGEEVTLADLTRRIDVMRPSKNLFAGLRVEGIFDELSLRAACPARLGEGLVEATSHQSEFQLENARGSLIGFWAPEYTMTVSVPGYHFHFIAHDRSRGGHVLDVRAHDLTIEVHAERDIHLSLPETEEFLTADLRGEHRAELDQAETGHSD
jgi:acetolactate decarboxylase